MKILLLVLLIVSCGCHSFPKIKASEIHSTTSALGVSSSVDATGINVTGSTAKASDVKWALSFPGFSHVTTAKDVVIPQEKETK